MNLKEALNIFLYEDARSLPNVKDAFKKGRRHNSFPSSMSEAAEACQRRNKARTVIEKFYTSLNNDSTGIH
jgi:hypothetical protein